MLSHHSNRHVAYRLRPLVAGLAIALSAQILAASGADHQHAGIGRNAASASHSPQPSVPTTWTVKNCDDDGADSLRDIVRPTNAQSGDIVDLSELPTRCGMADSTITLSSGEIIVSQGSLTLLGPDTGSVTISGGNASRVLYHQGNGMLTLDSLTIADGHYQVATNASGGCLLSGGAVYLKNVTVTGCKVGSDTNFAYGGGIWASGDVTLVSSKISSSEATAPLGTTYGGGILTGGALTTYYSTITADTAGDGQASGGWGGGAYVNGGALIVASTIDNSAASYGSALFVKGAAIIRDTTISDNTSNICCAISARGPSLAIANSTVAFNVATVDFGYGAVFFNGPAANSSVELQSTIIANNTAGATHVEKDLYVESGHGILSGADNLVMQTNIPVPPVGVITATIDPKLGPLQANGGPTRTRALLPGSPALAKGNDNFVPIAAFDQRGFGYPRTTGNGANIKTDIGAVEFDSIYFGDFD